jgi:twitching motility protein PilT
MAIDQAMLAAESDCLVLAAITAHDTAGALFQLVASAPPDERDVFRIRLASTLRAVISQRMVFPSGEAGKPRGKAVQVEWVEVTRGLRDALTKSADPAPLRKAIAAAAREGHAELFPKDDDDEGAS